MLVWGLHFSLEFVSLSSPASCCFRGADSHQVGCQVSTVFYWNHLCFRITKIWRFAWLLLRAPPSGHTAKHMLEWAAFPLGAEGACGLSVFMFLVQDPGFPLCSPALHPLLPKEPACLLPPSRCLGGCFPATSCCQDAWEPHLIGGAAPASGPLGPSPFPPFLWDAQWQRLG